MPESFGVNRPWWMKSQEAVTVKWAVDLVSVGWEEGVCECVCVLTPNSAIVCCLCCGSRSNTELGGGIFNSGSHKTLEHLIESG